MVVGPGYYLVCYNIMSLNCDDCSVVGPGYYLVCYNFMRKEAHGRFVVGPGYYLVCYNWILYAISCPFGCRSRLLFGML